MLGACKLEGKGLAECAQSEHSWAWTETAAQSAGMLSAGWWHMVGLGDQMWSAQVGSSHITKHLTWTVAPAGTLADRPSKRTCVTGCNKAVSRRVRWEAR
jgi:hypothetical protein